MAYRIEQIAATIGLEGSHLPRPDAVVSFLLFDSRQLNFPDTSLFIALKGKRQDGHQFISGLYDRGVRNFLVHSSFSSGPFPEANFLFCSSTVSALQQLAAYHRSRFNLPVIAITGSNGKTIVKEWLYQLLHRKENIVRSPKSFNSQIGVPVSVWNLREEHTLAIFEAGISRPGEMENLAEILAPNIGLFTYLGPAHNGGFSGLEQKVREKLLLFSTCHALVYCKDNELVHREMNRIYPDKSHFSWSRNGKAFLEIKSVDEITEGRSMIRAVTEDRELSITVPFRDKASIENAISCWTCILAMGYDHQTIAPWFSELEKLGMRLDMKAAVDGCLLINDAYNNDLHSLKIALDFMEQQAAGKNRTLILSDILQSGMSADVLYREVAKLVKAGRIDRLFGIGSQIISLKPFLPPGVEAGFYPGTRAFLSRLAGLSFQNEAILLKGARSFTFERIADRLAKKVHKTTLEINLDAMKNNLNVYSGFLGQGVRMMAMVKASGYGSGSQEIARLLQFQNVDYLAVAYADEGIELRKSGIRLPIMVLNPEEATFEALFRHNLEPEIYSISLLHSYQDAASGLCSAPGIHLKLETGMNRLGFDSSALGPLLAALKSDPEIKVISVFSHLAASEDIAEDDYTRGQASLFLEFYERICEVLGYRPMRHLLNSSGIHRFPEYQMEMVRLGIGLYGIDQSGRIEADLEPVLSLKATVSQIRKVKEGETIGYGRSGRLQGDRVIAVVSIGYADGLLRLAGRGNYQLLVRGKRAPIVGHICMDMTMIDVTGIEGVREGDVVVIFGEDPDISELAIALDTIPYEVLTNISERVKRVYFQS